MSRFESLLNVFGLSNRLITDFETVNIEEYIEIKIEWDRVNEILEKEKNKAMKFLRENLK